MNIVLGNRRGRRIASSSKFGERVAGVDGHRREALVGEPPDRRISGGSLTLDPGHPKPDHPNLELLIADYRPVGRKWGLFALLTLPWALLGGCSGCGDSSTPRPPDASGQTSISSQTPGGLLEIAIGNLDRQEEFPSGEMLQQILDQLNQWVRAQRAPDDWKLDPLLATLPAPMADMPAVRNLGQLQFLRSDALALQEAVWLRNVSRWARGDELDEVGRAGGLFDWTVRNIQLEVISGGESGERLGQLPWETLLLGRGTAMERAWVFILLARQQGLDAALLALSDPNDPAGGPSRPWAVGVLSGGNVYVFDPALGLPLPGPGGIRLDDTGRLEVRPATLAQLAADDSLLRRLDLDRDRPYPLRSSDLGRVVALVEASPAYLARRMQLVQSRLSGQQKIVLSASATAQAERWKAAPRISAAQLWVFPYRVLLEYQDPTQEQTQQRMTALLPFYVNYAAPAWEAEPSVPAGRKKEADDPDYQSFTPRRTSSQKEAKEAPLRKARILHLKGQLAGPQGATGYYQEARPSDEQLANMATYYYELALKDVQKLPQEQRPTEQQLKQGTAERARVDEVLLRRAKQDASYWLGLMNFDLGLIELQRKDHETAVGHFRVAIDYLLTRTLEASADGPWTHGAHYNLARSYEATRQYAEAIARYASDPTSPTYFGNLLRARWLNELRPATKEEPPVTKQTTLRSMTQMRSAQP